MLQFEDAVPASAGLGLQHVVPDGAIPVVNSVRSVASAALSTFLLEAKITKHTLK